MLSDIEDNDVEAIEEEPQGENIENSDTEANKDEDGNDENEDGEQEKKVIKPKRIVRNPQPKLNAETLKGARGLVAMPEMFKKQKYKGRGHEEEDLRTLLKTYEYWCHRLFPKYPFEESVEKIEKLGAKKPVITLIKKIRMGLMEEEPKEPEASSDEEPEVQQQQQPPTAESQFDQLVSKSTSLPVQLTEDQLERIRLNKEKAIKLRQERLKRIQQQAESKLMASNQLPSIQQEQSQLEVDTQSSIFTSSEPVLDMVGDNELSLTAIEDNLESCEDTEQPITHADGEDLNELSLTAIENNLESCEDTEKLSTPAGEENLSFNNLESCEGEQPVTTQAEVVSGGLSLTAIEKNEKLSNNIVEMDDEDNASILKKSKKNSNSNESCPTIEAKPSADCSRSSNEQLLSTPNKNDLKPSETTEEMELGEDDEQFTSPKI